MKRRFTFGLEGLDSIQAGLQTVGAIKIGLLDFQAI